MADKSLALQEYFEQPALIERFNIMAGEAQARSYMQSVILAVQENPQLSICDPMSVAHEALRAANLGLSCDPVQKEAQLVPRKVKGKWVAHLEPHYLGLYKLATRTNKYQTINVMPVLKHQQVVMGRDGLHYVQEAGQVIGHWPVDRVTAKNLPNVRGWLGYFKTIRGFEKTAYMSVEEIMEHAKTYSASYQADLRNKTKYSPWSKPEILPTMQMKTVLKELLKWADLSGQAGETLASVLDDEQVVDAESVSDLADPQLDVDKAFPPDPVASTHQNLSEDELVASLTGDKPKKAEPNPVAKYDKTQVMDALSAEAVQFMVDAKAFQTPTDCAKIVAKFKPRKAPIGVLVQKATLYRSKVDEGWTQEEAIEFANNFKGE